jgi:diacylglycerol kinase family enzyme
MATRRLAALGSLLCLAAAAAGLVGVLLSAIDVEVVLLFAVALAAIRYGGRSHGLGRDLARAGGLLLAAALIVDIFLIGVPLAELVLVGGVFAGLALARSAFAVHIQLPAVDPPRRPVLLWNPRSGGGAAERLDLVGQARARGIRTVVLQPDDDLEALARAAVAQGADALAMAGGDGSQAVVAAVAAEHGLPYACIPAGTRNHFALDLGVDRDDVLGALDALGPGAGERRVDLGEVNGRVFVNNVSLGVYAMAVQRPGYRARKVATLFDALRDALSGGQERMDLRWRGPSGRQHRGALLVLVSNNPYRLSRLLGIGTRPRLDEGLLGVTVVSRALGVGGSGRGPQLPWREWQAAGFGVAAAHPVPAGIDGEGVALVPPLRFAVRPGALRVRIAAHHPGASPSAAAPAGPVSALGALVQIVLHGRSGLEPEDDLRSAPPDRAGSR